MTETERGLPALDARTHRALSSPARQRIIQILRTHDTPVDVNGLADQLGLHVSTVRSHLSVLQDANLVAATSQKGQGPGRPRLVYRAVSPDGDLEPGSYRMLAGILTSYFASSVSDPSADAEDLGRIWGRHLIDTPAPFSRVEAGAAVDQVVALLDDYGFAAERDDSAGAGPAVLLRHCPFREVAKEHPEVVCALHLGIMKGAFAELAADVRVVDLLPFVEPSLCVSHLELAG